MLSVVGWTEPFLTTRAYLQQHFNWRNQVLNVVTAPQLQVLISLLGSQSDTWPENWVALGPNDIQSNQVWQGPVVLLQISGLCVNMSIEPYPVHERLKYLLSITVNSKQTDLCDAIDTFHLKTWTQVDRPIGTLIPRVLSWVAWVQTSRLAPKSRFKLTRCCVNRTISPSGETPQPIRASHDEDATVLWLSLTVAEAVGSQLAEKTLRHHEHWLGWFRNKLSSFFV